MGSVKLRDGCFKCDEIRRGVLPAASRRYGYAPHVPFGDDCFDDRAEWESEATEWRPSSMVEGTPAEKKRFYRDTVSAALTEDPQTVDEITNTVSDTIPSITEKTVVVHLKAMVKAKSCSIALGDPPPRGGTRRVLYFRRKKRELKNPLA